MLELEKKVPLTKQEYKILFNSVCFKQSAETQKNYYYDTTDFELNRKGITCRIREKNGCFVATIKEHQADWKECSVENTRSLTSLKDDTFFTNMGLCCHGCLTTERSTFEFCPGVQMMLDKNKYLSAEDYELEIEYTPKLQKEASKALALVDKLLTSSGVIADGSVLRQRLPYSQSKASRFFQRKKILLRKETR